MSKPTCIDILHLTGAAARQCTDRRAHLPSTSHIYRKPTLHIHCSKPGSAALTLRLLPTCDPQVLQLRKLLPDVNAVRTISSQPAATSVNTTAKTQPSQSGSPTPHYNTSVLQVWLHVEIQAYAMDPGALRCTQGTHLHTSCLCWLAQDALLPRHAAAIGAAVATLPRLGDAIALLRSWARRHGLAAAPDGVTGFHVAMLAVHLQQQGSLVSNAAWPLAGIVVRCTPMLTVARHTHPCNTFV
jgi:Nrap protein domain 1